MASSSSHSINNGRADKAKAAAAHDHDENDTGVQLSAASTFVESFPRKVRTGGPHPHLIVETAAMNAVEPPDVKISLSIPEAWIDSGALSCVQMEAVVYACQSHEQHLLDGNRRGFLIGDGAGVGKGRTIAGIIVHNYELGRKRHIWLSVSTDLRFDAARDLEDVGGKTYCPIYHLSKFKYGSIRAQQPSSSKGIMFATYASLVGKSKAGESRLNQLIEWFGKDYDGCIIFDECHRAKNLCPKVGTASSMIGKAVLDIQRALPEARIVYASATGATEPRNMAYMERLGIWGHGTVFHEFGDFLEVVNKRGIGAMELVAMDLKRRGLYIARQLSFQGVDFNVHEVPLTNDFKRIYDEAVAFWTELHTQFSRAFALLAAQKKKSYKAAWTHFYSAAQRFFKHLCIAVKVPMCVEIAQKALEQGKCVVIGLQSTGESQTNEALEEGDGDLEEFVSTPKQLLISLIEKYFPVDPDDDYNDRKDPLKALFRGIDSEERKWKRKHGKFDIDELEREAKRQRLSADDEEEDEAEDTEEATDKNDKAESSAADNEESEKEEESDEEEKSEVDEEDSGNEDGGGGGRNYTEMDTSKDAFVKELLNELDSDSDDEVDEDMKDSDTEGSPKMQDSEDEDERALSLFCIDYSKNDAKDPWEKRQRLVSENSFQDDSMPKKKSSKSMSKEVRKIKNKKPLFIEPKEEKIYDFAKKVANEMKFTSITTAAATSFQDCTSSESHDSGFNNELFTIDISKIRSSEVSLHLSMVKEELLDRATKVGENLPINTLDALIDQLGGTGNVSEMTGRRGRVIRCEDGTMAYKRRNEGENVNLDLINIQEKDHFMNGTKLVAIISEAASSGISLHADRRALNKRKRVHITLELPWSADRAVQQFGRTHRSNQEYPPEYLFLISELAGEKRFVSTASKRLQSLGALTHGDRRAVAESDDLSRFSIENKWGKQALQILLEMFIDPQKCAYPPKNGLANLEFFNEARDHVIRLGILKVTNGELTIDRENGNLNKFLNRLLLMPVDIQNSIFDYYMSLFSLLVYQAKRQGKYDNGTMDLGSTTDQVTRAKTRVFSARLSGTYFEILIHQIDVDRGMTWKDVSTNSIAHANGVFGYKTYSKTNRRGPFYSFQIGTNIMIMRPNTGRTSKPGNLQDFLSTHEKYSEDEMGQCKKDWQAEYKLTEKMCYHEYKTGTKHPGCEAGKRIRAYYVCAGAVLTAWKAVEAILSKGNRSHIQIVRIQTNENQKLVGVLVRPNELQPLINELEKCYFAKEIRSY